MRRRRVWIPVLGLIAGLAVTACGSGSDPQSTDVATASSHDAPPPMFDGTWHTISDAALSNDGKRIAVVADDPADAGGTGYGWRIQGTTHLLLADVDTGKVLRDTVIAAPGRVGPGSFVAFGSDECSVLVGPLRWDACRGVAGPSLIPASAGGVAPNSISVSRGGTTSVTVQPSGRQVLVWDTARATIRRTIELPAEVGNYPSVATAVSPDGRSVAAISAPREDNPGQKYTYRLRVYDVASGRLIAQDDTAGAMFEWSIRLTDDGDVYAAGSGRQTYNGDDPYLLAWTVIDGRPAQHPIRPSFSPTSAAPVLSADGRTFVVQVDSGREPNHAVDTTSGADFDAFPATQGHVTFSPSTPAFVAAPSAKGPAHVWSSPRDSGVQLPDGVPATMRVRFAGSGNRLIAYRGEQLLVIDAATGSALRASP